jgi:hypothetical protein
MGVPPADHCLIVVRRGEGVVEAERRWEHRGELVPPALQHLAERAQASTKA